MGTYDTLGGTPRHDPMFDNDGWCEICKRCGDACVCPECKVCGVHGDPRCYVQHGMELNEAQRWPGETNEHRASRREDEMWARTTRGSCGVTYEVLRGEDLVWARFVPFTRRNTAGSFAFREAAREQERVLLKGAP